MRLHREHSGRGSPGGVEPRRDRLAAARRERFEETGYSADPLLILDYTYSFPVADRWRDLYGADEKEIREHTFVAEVLGDAWQWYTFEHAMSLLKWPENITGLRHTHALLQRRASPSTS